MKLHRQGKQGQLDTAPKSTLAAEFDTEDTDEVIKKILEKGTVQVSEVSPLHPSPSSP